MLAKLYSYAILGLDDGLIEVEVDISQGLPAFTIVGLPDAAVQESRERIRPAEVSRLSQWQYRSRFVLSARSHSNDTRVHGRGCRFESR